MEIVFAAMFVFAGIVIWVFGRTKYSTKQLSTALNKLAISEKRRNELTAELAAMHDNLETAEKLYLARHENESKTMCDSLEAQQNQHGVELAKLRSRLEAQQNRHGVELAEMRGTLEAQQTNVHALGGRLLKDSVKFIGAKVTANNYATSKKQFEAIFDFCEKNGYLIPESERQEILQDLKQSFEMAVQKQWQKEEQARIKRQIREEEKLEADRQRELQRLQNEELAIQTALQKALQKAKDEHDVEVERLKGLLEQAQTKLQRAKSMAELTKSGFVYVISNIGSFGENVFKVGMTRRYEPLERVYELGDASVPFRYDVHMMISSDNAPALEHALHQDLHKFLVNKVNLRREFFRTDIDTIAHIVEKNYGKVEYVTTPEALEYNETLNMTDEDFNYVSQELAKFKEDEEGYRIDAPLQQPKIPQAKDNSSNIHIEDIAKASSAGSSDVAPAPTDGMDSIAQSAKQTEEKRRVASCPFCKGSIYVDTLTFGENSCPHCNQTFRVKGNKQSDNKS
jgi:ribosomal protein L37AE/L43A